MRIIKGALSTFGILETPAPWVQVSCYIPRINLSTEVDFLIDTGACESCLNGSVALGIQPHMRKSTLQSSTGIGGKCGYYKETAILIFTDTAGRPVDRQIELGVQRINRCLWKKPNILLTPCLLGRDILLPWELQYNHRKHQVDLIVP
jgi:hypothetical protein